MNIKLIAAIAVSMFAKSVHAGAIDNPSDLIKGQDYALIGTGDGVVDLINPYGVATVHLDLSRSITSGAEFRAAYTATYFVRWTYPDNSDRVGRGWVVPDCKAGVKTKCSFVIGSELDSQFNWNSDDDWFRLNLKKNRYYTFTYTTNAPRDVIMTVFDKSGHFIINASQSNRVDPGSKMIIRFRPKTDGIYFLSVRIYDDPTTFTVQMR